MMNMSIMTIMLNDEHSLIKLNLPQKMLTIEMNNLRRLYLGFAQLTLPRSAMTFIIWQQHTSKIVLPQLPKCLGNFSKP